MYQIKRISRKKYEQISGISSPIEKDTFYYEIYQKKQSVAVMKILLKETCLLLSDGIIQKNPSEELSCYLQEQLKRLAREKKVTKVQIMEKKKEPRKKPKKEHIVLKKEKLPKLPSYFVLKEVTSEREKKNFQEFSNQKLKSKDHLFTLSLDLYLYLDICFEEEKEWIQNYIQEMGTFLLLEGIVISEEEDMVALKCHEEYSSLFKEERKNVLHLYVQNKLAELGYKKLFIKVPSQEKISILSKEENTISSHFLFPLLPKRRG